jgi:AraC-like DNA-binding protein
LARTYEEPSVIDDPTAIWNDFRALCVGLEAVGAPVDVYLAREGLPRLDALTPEDLGRVDGKRAWERVWMHAAEDRRDPWLPATVGALTPFGAFEIVDYAATAAPSLGQSLRQLSRYLRLISPDLQLRVDDSEPLVRVTMTAAKTDRMSREVASLYTLGICFSRYAERTVGGFEVTTLTLESQRPDGAPSCPLERYSQTPARYGQPQFSFTVAREVWGRPLDGSSPGLAAVLHRHAEELIARRGLSDLPTDRFRTEIRRHLLDGDAGVEPVARALGLSARTLHRRLKEQGWTFQALLDAERKEVAFARLHERRLSVGEIAYLLGYAEQSAFLRAFRRWTGNTPTQFRASARAE